MDGAFAVEWTVAYAPPIGADCRVLHGAGRGAIGLAACNCAKVGVVALAAITLNAVPDTSYASCGDLSLAYQVFGDGPVELVFAGPFVSHVELFWTLPEFKALPRRQWSRYASMGSWPAGRAPARASSAARRACPGMTPAPSACVTWAWTGSRSRHEDTTSADQSLRQEHR